MKTITLLVFSGLLALTGCNKPTKQTDKKAATSKATAMAASMTPCDCPHKGMKPCGDCPNKGMKPCGDCPNKGMPASGDCPHKGMPAPIDCPFANMKPSHMGHGGHHHGDKHRPFKSVAKYIAKLDQKDRATWQKPEAVIAALKLKPDSVVADVGAGSGYFALRIAAKYPKGKVIAIDIEPKMLTHIQARAKALKLTNLTTALSKGGDPMVTDKADLVLIADVLHHVPGAPAWLARMFKSMKKGARLAIIEFKEGNLPKGPPAHIKIPKAKLLKLLTGAGFTAPVVDDKTLPYQLLVILKKP